MAKNQITAEGLADLKDKLAAMEGPGRQAIADRILVARGFGDLSENAEYHAAKDDQAHHETAILRLKERIADAEVVSGAPADGKVGFGSTVTWLDGSAGREQTFTIVASHEASPADGKLSAESPIAVALTGAGEGDSVVVDLPAGKRELKILKVA